MFWNARYEDEKSEELLKLCSRYKKLLGLEKISKYTVVIYLLDSLYNKLKKRYEKEQTEIQNETISEEELEEIVKKIKE